MQEHICVLHEQHLVNTGFKKGQNQTNKILVLLTLNQD